MAAEIPTAKDLTELVSLLAPALIILGIRQWFSVAPPPEFKERAISYAGVSAVYFAVFGPVFQALPAAKAIPWLTSWSEYFFLPALLGAAYAAATYFDLPMWFWRKLRIQPVHSIPTAWDYAFNRRAPTCVAVTLTDGKIIYGIYGPGSFTSSISAERDIIISSLCILKDGKWEQATPIRSIMLFGRDIKSIEFFGAEK